MTIQGKIILLSITLPVLLLIYGIFAQQYTIALNALLTIFCIIALACIHKKFPVLSTGTYYAVLLFILLSVFAGRSLKFYFLIPHWDKILHFLSGFIIAPVGKQIYRKLNGKIENKALVNWFAILFSVAAAGVWEIHEFTADAIFGTNAQNGSLRDTMLDMIAGSASAILAMIITPKTKS